MLESWAETASTSYFSNSAAAAEAAKLRVDQVDAQSLAIIARGIKGLEPTPDACKALEQQALTLLHERHIADMLTLAYAKGLSAAQIDQLKWFYSPAGQQVVANLTEQGQQAMLRLQEHPEEIMMRVGVQQPATLEPQTDDVEEYSPKASRCEKGDMDFCLHLDGGTHGVHEYYSRKGWEIEGTQTLAQLEQRIEQIEHFTPAPATTTTK